MPCLRGEYAITPQISMYYKSWKGKCWIESNFRESLVKLKEGMTGGAQSFMEFDPRTNIFFFFMRGRKGKKEGSKTAASLWRVPLFEVVRIVLLLLWCHNYNVETVPGSKRLREMKDDVVTVWQVRARHTPSQAVTHFMIYSIIYAQSYQTN